MDEQVPAAVEAPRPLEEQTSLKTLPLFLFGGFYLGFKGFIKEGLGLLFTYLVMATILVDYVIDPKTDQNQGLLYMGTSLIFNLIVGYKWDDYISSKKNKVGAPKRSWWRNLLMFIPLSLLMMLGIGYADQGVKGIYLRRGLALEKEGREKEALGIFRWLCLKEMGEGCFEFAERVSAMGLKDRALELYRRGCSHYDPNSCLGAAKKYHDAGDKEKAEDYRQQACELGSEEACRD